MNLPQVSIFERVRFVLVETSRPGNIGAAARAMKTMGFSDLVLVNPRLQNATSHEEAIAFASGAQDILQSAKIVDSIDAALAECNFTAAITSRLREFSPPVMTPRAFANQLTHPSHTQIGLLFGNERFGLPNTAVEKCNVLINIPANPHYASLNLAQAVQVLAYECKIAACADTLPETPIGFQSAWANATQIEGAYTHLEQALIALDFLDPAKPKKLMSRLKRLFSRTQLEIEEVNILRGIATKILQHKK